jgi:single-stranded DNA-binding protein
VKDASMHLITINNEPETVAVFTVCDIGLPYQKLKEPVFMQVNYRKEAANYICEYLKENKEVIVYGNLRQKFVRNDETGAKEIRYFILADNVVLLPQFVKAKKEEETKN